MDLRNAKLGEVYRIYTNQSGTNIMEHGITPYTTTATVIAISKDRMYVRLGWKEQFAPALGLPAQLLMPGLYNPLPNIDDYRWGWTVSSSMMVDGLVEAPTNAVMLASNAEVRNDHTCPHCGNKRCDKRERTCWSCTKPLHTKA